MEGVPREDDAGPPGRGPGHQQDGDRHQRRAGRKRQRPRRRDILSIMRYRRIGRTSIEVSEIGFGCWTMGGLNWVDGHPNGWANVDEAAITQAIKRAGSTDKAKLDRDAIYAFLATEAYWCRGIPRVAASGMAAQSRYQGCTTGPNTTTTPSPA